MGNLKTPQSVQRLQTALHAKAKEEPDYRFYLLYDKMYRMDVLHHAYQSCKANKGAAGVDGVRFEDIEAAATMRMMMGKIKLTVNEDKTHVCRLPQERFDFLGYTFGRCYSRVTGRAYIGTRPSKKSIQRIVAAISEDTDLRRTFLDAEVMVGRLNRKLAGWANYFCLGPVSPAYRAINTHVTRRLRRWLCGKHKVENTGKRYSDQYLYEELGLINLPGRTRNLPWAKA